MSDPYTDMAEFHEVFMYEPWQRLEPVLRQAFGGLDPTSTIVDVGAGTGMGTRVLATATAAAIVAMEPNRTMRTALVALVAGDPALAQRVTVLPGAAPDGLAQIAGRVDGFVCGHMLGHLGAAQRSATFSRLASLMTPEGLGVVTFAQEPDGADDGADGEYVEQAWLGRLRYDARYVDAGSDRFEVEYVVLDGTLPLRRERFSGAWRPIAARTLERELAAHGLVLEPVSATAGLVRVASRPVAVEEGTR